MRLLIGADFVFERVGVSRFLEALDTDHFGAIIEDVLPAGGLLLYRLDLAHQHNLHNGQPTNRNDRARISTLFVSWPSIQTESAALSCIDS